jgi:hypothetical protein
MDVHKLRWDDRPDSEHANSCNEFGLLAHFCATVIADGVFIRVDSL